MLLADMEQITDALRNNIWYFVAGIGGLIVILLLVKLIRPKTNKPKQTEKRQEEYLEDYPPAPPRKGDRRLTFDGIDVRLRLVVIAPMGKQQQAIQPDDVAELLEDVLRGLGHFVQADKPRVRIWEPQLSAKGFAPTFHRLVESPDEDGKKSHWIRVAGVAKAAGTPILLGLALYAEEATKLGAVILEGKEWVESLQVEKQA